MSPFASRFVSRMGKVIRLAKTGYPFCILLFIAASSTKKMCDWSWIRG